MLPRRPKNSISKRKILSVSYATWAFKLILLCAVFAASRIFATSRSEQLAPHLILLKATADNVWALPEMNVTTSQTP